MFQLLVVLSAWLLTPLLACPKAHAAYSPQLPPLLRPAPKGTVEGTVTDPEGHAIYGSKVTIENKSKTISQTVTTAADGVYRFAKLPPGDYTVTVAAPGFAAYTREINLSAEPEPNHVIQGGQSSETIEVVPSSRPKHPHDASPGVVQPSTPSSSSEPEPPDADHPAEASVKRGVVQESSAAPGVALTNGKYYALVIGIDHYPSGLPALQTAVSDASSIGTELEQEYGFKVAKLLDRQATRDMILNQINWYRTHLDVDDNLLIYYAGHGYMDRDADKAYWLPVDADSALSPHRISADDLATEVRVQSARHVLIISDSCYSGDLTRDLGEIPRASEHDVYLKFLGRMLNSRSRTIMASGGDEPVTDAGANGHSVFANALLTALKSEDHEVFAASDLFFQHVRQRVGGGSNQQPRYDIIRNSNHEEGDFVFMRGGVVDLQKAY